MANTSILNAFERMWHHTSDALNKKVNITDIEDVVYAEEDNSVSASVPINADTLGGRPASDFALKDAVGYDLMDLESALIDRITEMGNTKAPAGYGLGEKIGVIPANSVATFVFSQSRHSALFSVRGNNGVACGNFLLNGYGAGGANRTMVKRLVGGDAILYGIVPQGNGTGITIWNNSGAEVQVSVLALLGSMPTMTVGSDGGATAEPFEYENPPMTFDVEYRTTKRYLGKPVYTQMVGYGALPNNTGKNVSLSVATTVTNLVGYSGSAVFGSEASAAALDTLISRLELKYNGIVRIETDEDRSGWSATFAIEYTKD